MLSGSLPLIVIGAVAVLALLLGFQQSLISRRLSRELQELKTVLKGEVETEQKASFSNHLDRVERQKQTVVTSRNSSEKYQYAASLADQGIDVKEIAAALQLAPAEVEQLLQLSRLKQQVQG